MSTTIWEPLRHLEEVDRMLSGLFTPAAAPERTWRPAAEVITEADAYRVRVDLPGVGKDGVDVSLERDVLTVRGERKPTVQAVTDDGEAKRTAVTSEVRAGKFVRSFRLPDDGDAAQVNASYVDGVLEVRVPRKQPPQPRKVEIGNA